jgi:hypothetical protein
MVFSFQPLLLVILATALLLGDALVASPIGKNTAKTGVNIPFKVAEKALPYKTTLTHPNLPVCK